MSLANLVRAAVAGNGEESTARNKILFTGCGTSGRLGWYAAASLNAYLGAHGRPAAFCYAHSGGDVALLLSRELPEDDPALGVADMEAALGSDTEAAVVVGISCGLSAPYVAGQMAHCLEHLDRYSPVLVGFNPVALSRDAPIEGWDQTFRQVATAVDAAQRSATGSGGSDGAVAGTCLVINPVVGPEPITGSTRMKGGSITKILIDAACASALGAVEAGRPAVDRRAILAALALHEEAYRQTYLQVEALGAGIAVGGEAVSAGGHVYYLGAGSAGLMGLIDASEMVDTYGAPPGEIKAFVAGGWSAMANVEVCGVCEWVVCGVWCVLCL